MATVWAVMGSTEVGDGAAGTTQVLVLRSVFLARLPQPEASTVLLGAELSAREQGGEPGEVAVEA